MEDRSPMVRISYYTHAYFQNTHFQSRKKPKELPNEPYLMCSECAKLFKYRNELTLHIKSKCGTVKLFQCNVLFSYAFETSKLTYLLLQVCNKMLMTPGSLHNHMLRHEGAPKYMCRFCAKLFLMAGQLKVHERIHTKEKVYTCDVSITTNQDTYWNQHNAIILDNSSKIDTL